MWINGKIKTPGFYNTADWHICLISLRLDVSLLTEIHYFGIEPSEEETHGNESIMLKMFYLCGFVRWTK